MTDPTTVTTALRDAEKAFEGRGREMSFETGVDQTAEWATQLTKACRYLEACRRLRAADGYNGAVVELCFGAMERTIEAYLVWATNDSVADFRDHERVYDRASSLGLFDPDTASDLRQLYRDNRTVHYYGGTVPTQQQENAMVALSNAVHRYTVEQIPDTSVCVCDDSG